MHYCTKCNQTLPLSEFYIDKRSGTPTWGCKSCRRQYYRDPERVAAKKAAYQRLTRETDPDTIRRWNLMRVYKMTPEQYAEKVAEQGGVCAICGWVPTGRHPLYVDHDHACCPGRYSCGKCVRGLLCPPCNSVLGRLNDNAAPLVAYLDRWS